MASLSLPAPTRTAPSSSAVPRPRANTNTTTTTAQRSHHQQQKQHEQTSSKSRIVPSYEERCRAASMAAKLTPEQRKSQKHKLFVPRSIQDFGDGGAFPEIHVAQYPRHMGNPHVKKKSKGGVMSQAIVNVDIDDKGEVSYDAIVKNGTNSDKIVYTKLSDVRGGEAKPEDVALPTEEEEEEAKQKTQAALQSLLQTKIALDRPTGSAILQAETSQNQESKTQFVKYKAREDAPGYNPAAATRVIQMVPAQIDPMMPPKHKHVKAPRGPAEDPVPVLHAPNTKLSKEEKAAWNIPACISNWKNTRGYTIPLDKRLAADGRHLQEHTINPNFATLSESLYVAERQARQEVRMRAQVQKKLALSEKEQREEELRKLANQVRMERQNQNQQQQQPLAQSTGRNETQEESKPANLVETLGDISSSSDEEDEDETDEQVAERQRERMRMERKRERERELRMENSGKSAEAIKKQRMESDRDVSEKIALGQLTGTGGNTLGGDVDSRLYNQNAGMDSGFGADDEYNTYSKPLFGGSSSSGGAGSASIYRPTRGETEHNADEQYDKLKQGSTAKFQPDQGFAGADGGGSGASGGAGPRTAPVQFEKGTN
mmetsp:Transcript_7551/g.10734  ORF Transcript_7551/g.10734 Transcript_7551/m.10734 type:complete len:602 (+) Transcript_7551:63-1868(+)